LNRLVVTAAALVVVACTPVVRQPAVLLDQADRLAGAGDYRGAVGTYDELLTRYPQDRLARRAQVRRDTIAGLLAARADVARLRDELGARDAELGRLRHEVQRLLAETERLRADIEELKRIDLRQEERRRR
jgi:hypothetical protein